LCGLLGAGGLTMAAVRALRPVGADVGMTQVVRAVLDDDVPQGGNPRGDLTMAVFTDYNCSACRIAHPEMMAAVEADGGVRLRYFDWPIFGDASREAARFAIAADRQGLYPQVHAALLSGGRADAGMARAALEAAGGDAALQAQTVQDDAARIEGRLSRNAFHAFSLGLGGTPGHLIGPVLVRGAVGAWDFGRAFAQARSASA